MSIFSKLSKSFIYAVKGFRTAFVSQVNIRIQCIATLFTIVAGFIFDVNSNEWLWLILNITLVLAAELFNTAIEGIVDFISPGYHEKAGKIKDIAAAAVTVLTVNAVVCAGIIFIPKISAALQ